ncbi:hypothetical protein L596_000649 [Steinernema carpocapsae]|uniref:Uncharacterized protein n=1 Tax=Steinernema carpocapsae TaxID=34508 RepID=A0A4U8UIP7_STECR|nr:hypothetical protein L596_000649 [Steinernema carpocapsae]
MKASKSTAVTMLTISRVVEMPVSRATTHYGLDLDLALINLFTRRSENLATLTPSSASLLCLSSIIWTPVSARSRTKRLSGILQRFRWRLKKRSSEGCLSPSLSATRKPTLLSAMRSPFVRPLSRLLEWLLRQRQRWRSWDMR